MFSFSLRAVQGSHRLVFHSVKHQSPRYPTRLSVRPLATAPPFRTTESINVGHSRFLAEGSSKSKWSKENGSPENGDFSSMSNDFDSVTGDRGKLSPTSSHLFKLILPLHKLQDLRRDNDSEADAAESPPTVFLLHPSQPLSHVSRLITASLTEPGQYAISFRSSAPNGRRLQWSDSTDVGDFIKDAARANEFVIHLQSKEPTDQGVGKRPEVERRLEVEVPTFADRTRFLRRRLERIEGELLSMEQLKHRCDREAHQGARRMAVGGLGMLVVYWGAVARLTFWDLGWDVMEPVTYLSGLSMVILGYLWFLYQGREVSYSSVLDRSISARRQALYKAHGFDIDRWLELVTEAKALRKEITKIAEDYDEHKWRERDEERKIEEVQQDKDVEDVKKAAAEDKSTSADQ